MSTIFTCKLSTGEEIIGREIPNTRLTPAKPDHIILEKVRVIAVQRMPDGSAGIGLMPYCLSQHDGEITLHRSAIISEFKATEQFEKVYMQQTSSIQLV